MIISGLRREVTSSFPVNCSSIQRLESFFHDATSSLPQNTTSSLPKMREVVPATDCALRNRDSPVELYYTLLLKCCLK
jgi:hypothetical protein